MSRRNDSSFDAEFLEGLQQGRRGRGRSGGGDGGGGGRRSRGRQKAMQLCRQAQRALNLTLAERGSDPVLEQLYVDEVTPAPGCGHLLVHFVAPAGWPLPDVLASLRRDAPRLRALHRTLRLQA